jgi:NitT/TauT family transport system substrate-binding protein
MEMEKNINVVKAMVVALTLFVSSGSALAGEVSFMCFPNAQSVPLMVLRAKAAEFLPAGTSIVLKHPEHKPQAIAKFLKTKQVDFASINHGLGAKLYSKGLKHIKLAGVHVWGGVGILSKIQIKPGDWAALKGKTGLAVPGLMATPAKLSMMAMKLHGLKPKQDLTLTGSNPHGAFSLMKEEFTAPDFVILPEPQLSHGLLAMKKQNWEQKYHLFADSVKSVTAFGMPIGSLWVVNESKDTAAIVRGFERAVAYTMNPEHRSEVAKIVAAGWKEVFSKRPPAAVFEAALKRGLLKMRFKHAPAIERKMRMVWEQMGVRPDSGIFYRGLGYKVPSAAFLTSNIMPRHVGIVLAHGDELGVSAKTKMAALKIRIGAHQHMAKQMKKYRQLEFAIFDAYQNDDWEKVGSLTKELSAHKLETTQVQIECIKKTQKMYDPADLVKIKDYLANNRNMIANYSGF